MSQEQSNEHRDDADQKPAARPQPPPSWWREYDGKPVAIQLRDGAEYVGVTYPNEFLFSEGRRPIVSPLLRGLLKVREDWDGTAWIIVQTDDPNPQHSNVKVDIALRPDLVAFVTATEQSLIRG